MPNTIIIKQKQSLIKVKDPLQFFQVSLGTYYSATIIPFFKHSEGFTKVLLLEFPPERLSVLSKPNKEKSISQDSELYTKQRKCYHKKGRNTTGIK